MAERNQKLQIQNKKTRHKDLLTTMDFKFTKKELIIISVVIFTPILIVILSFSFGKLSLSVKRAKFKKAGIPTTIQEYNDKYYNAIPDNVNALKTLKRASLLYNKKENNYIFDKHRPILDQKINSQLYVLHQKILTDNEDFYNEIKKTNKFNKIRYKCNYEIIEWKGSKCDFFDASDYFIAKIEYAISKKDSKLIVELLKLAFHINTFSSQIPYTSYYCNNLDYFDKIVLAKFTRCLSIIKFSKNDLEEFIKIFNKHEKLSKKVLKRSYIQCIVTNFELTDRKNLKQYCKQLDLRGSFFHHNENLLAICLYASGLNSHDALIALEINNKQQKLFWKPYCKIISQLMLLAKENDTFIHLNMLASSSIAMNMDSIRYTYNTINRLRCAKTACAVELFRLKHKKLPVSLKQLVPDFLSGIPTDIFDGKELKYKYGNFKVMYPTPEFDTKNKLTHNVKKTAVKKYGYYIYSVGENLIDDNGDLLNFNTYSSKDITVPVAIKTK